MWIHSGRLVQYNNLKASEISVVGFLPLTDADCCWLMPTFTLSHKHHVKLSPYHNIKL